MPNINPRAARMTLRYAGWQNRQRIAALNHQVARHSRPQSRQAPVVIFNASARLTGLSLNAAFSLLVGWGLRLVGTPIIHFACQSGMSHCVLGTSRSDYTTPPPCPGCQAQTRRLYSGSRVHGFTYREDRQLADELQGLSTSELGRYEYQQAAEFKTAIPLGKLTLPSIRWALRVHNLPDDQPTRYLFGQYILSAYRVAREFHTLIQKTSPQTGVIFNGMMYPEAAVRWVARQNGLRTVAHEVGFQKYSTFFTEGEPTAYPIHIPKDFELTSTQNAQLDSYLEQRFRGKFTMAGIQFWPEMHGLDAEFLQKAEGFRQIVPVFTNVVYDTSQVHANIVFPHMFAWLDLVREVIQAHPETLFVIRAHPDEMRPGTAKQSNESVHDWVQQNQIGKLPNVVFIDSQEYISSYELIQRAKFVMVYNSSIGLEATLMGKPVLCGGKARYTQYPIVFFPDDISGYRRFAEDLLQAAEIYMPPEFQHNARRFLYYQLYRTSLPMNTYLETIPRMGFVQLRRFSWEKLLPKNSPTMDILAGGILHGKPFLMPDK